MSSSEMFAYFNRTIRFSNDPYEILKCLGQTGDLLNVIEEKQRKDENLLCSITYLKASCKKAQEDRNCATLLFSEDRMTLIRTIFQDSTTAEAFKAANSLQNFYPSANVASHSVVDRTNHAFQVGVGGAIVNSSSPQTLVAVTPAPPVFVLSNRQRLLNISARIFAAIKEDQYEQIPKLAAGLSATTYRKLVSSIICFSLFRVPALMQNINKVSQLFAYLIEDIRKRTAVFLKLQNQPKVILADAPLMLTPIDQLPLKIACEEKIGKERILAALGSSYLFTYSSEFLNILCSSKRISEMKENDYYEEIIRYIKWSDLPLETATREERNAQLQRALKVGFNIRSMAHDLFAVSKRTAERFIKRLKEHEEPFTAMQAAALLLTSIRFLVGSSVVFETNYKLVLEVDVQDQINMNSDFKKVIELTSIGVERVISGQEKDYHLKDVINEVYVLAGIEVMRKFHLFLESLSPTDTLSSHVLNLQVVYVALAFSYYKADNDVSPNLLALILSQGVDLVYG